MVLGAIAEAQGRRWLGWWLLLIALWLMVMLLAIKVWLGWASGSLSLMAGGLLTLLTSFSLLLSLLTLSPPHSARRDAFGHGRWESGLVFLLVGVMGFACCSLLSRAGQQLIGGRSDASIAAPIPLSISLIQLLGSATAIGLVIGIVGYYQARMLNQPTLKLSFRQSLIDASLMILILLGLIGSNLGLRWLDPVLAGVIVLIAVVNGWQVLNRQLPSLMQQVAIAPEALAAAVHQVEGILHCYAIQSRGLVGRLVYIEMRLILHPECMTVASTIVARVERVICQQFGPVKVVVHVESNHLTRDSRSS